MHILLIILSITCSLLTPVFAASHHTIAKVDIETAEKQVIAMINQVRQNEGLPPLKEWKELTLCARKHSQNMAKGLVAFGHDGFEERSKEMKKHAPWKKFGENVAYSYNKKDPLKTAVNGWMNSPKHRKTILNDYEETGIGIAYSQDGSFYITQLFVIRKS